MIECPMPQDILKYKSKFIANLSIRESICGFAGIGFGFIAYFSWFSSCTANMRIFLSSLVILPFLLVGFIKLYDQPFEKVAPKMILENFVYPLKRYKEVGHPEFEKYEKTRYWQLNNESQDIEETPGNKKSRKGASVQKVNVVKSATYVGIK